MPISSRKPTFLPVLIQPEPDDAHITEPITVCSCIYHCSCDNAHVPGIRYCHVRLRKIHVVPMPYILNANFQLPILKRGVVEGIHMARLTKLVKKLGSRKKLDIW